jgi:hypothetical protein
MVVARSEHAALAYLFREPKLDEEKDEIRFEKPVKSRDVSQVVTPAIPLGQTHSDPHLLIHHKNSFNQVCSILRHFRRDIVFGSTSKFHHGRNMRIVKRKSAAEKSIKNDPAGPNIDYGTMVICAL